MSSLRDLSPNIRLIDQTQQVPIRWTAPEALRHGVFSAKSDVWSFGVVCYEIVTFGNEPYDGAKNAEVVEMVCQQGVRLPCPEKPCAPLGCPKAVHDMMLGCWQTDPDDRPDFEELCENSVPALRRRFSHPLA